LQRKTLARAAATKDQGLKEQRIKIHDIAEDVGVSIATVSRVLNGRPDVADSTRALVMDHIRKRDYTDARRAQGQLPHESGLIGVTVPRMTGGYFSEILAGITTSLDERGTRPLIAETFRDRGREVAEFKRFGPGAVDGVILILPIVRAEQIDALLLRGYPVVVIDPAHEMSSKTPVVMSDHMGGAVQATEHLLELGHTRIGVITGPIDEVASSERLDGYKFALYKHGLPFDASLLMTSNFEFQGGYDATGKLLDQSHPTAIFCFNDAMAAGAIRAAWERKLELPHDLSIVGFDDAETSTLVTPDLTTVHQSLRGLGHTAVNTLYQLREGKQAVSSRSALATHLIPRGSTASPSNKT